MANDHHPTRVGYRPSSVAGYGSQKINDDNELSEAEGVWLWRHGLKIQALAAKVEADETAHQESLDAIQRAADPEWDAKRQRETQRRRASRLAQQEQ